MYFWELLWLKLDARWLRWSPFVYYSDLCPGHKLSNEIDPLSFALAPFICKCFAWVLLHLLPAPSILPGEFSTCLSEITTQLLSQRSAVCCSLSRICRCIHGPHFCFLHHIWTKVRSNICLMAGEIAQWAHCCHAHMMTWVLMPQHPHNNPDMAACTCNSRAEEAETGRSLESIVQLTWLNRWTLVYWETLSQNTWWRVNEKDT